MVCLKVMQYFETVTEFLRRNLLHTDLTWNSTCSIFQKTQRIFGEKSQMKEIKSQRKRKRAFLLINFA